MFGGSGWLGRSLIHRLTQKNICEILVFGESPRSLDLAGQRIQVHLFSLPVAEVFRPSVVVHLAALTRDRLATTAEKDYVNTNQRLLQEGLALSQIPSVSTVVSVSSGAAITDDGLYGESKREQENAFESLRDEVSAQVVNARVWSVSGRFCTKPNAFAITSMIQEAKTYGTVTVRSENPVRRRYTDAGEFLDLAIQAGQRRLISSIDSGGELIEMENLAVRISDIFGAKVRCPSVRLGPGDDYFSSDSSMLEVSRQLNFELTSLEGQIARTGEDL